MMNTSSDKELDGLRRWVNEAMLLAEKVTDHIVFDRTDDYSFMALTFLYKQVCHMKSILILGMCKDVELVARSMLEGMCLLKWAADNKKDRAFQWRAFAIIHNWRTMKINETEGRPLENETKNKLLEELDAVSETYLKSSALELFEKGHELPDDPYVDNWTKKPMWKIFKKVEATSLYKTHYHAFSAWHHWSIAAIGQTIDYGNDGYSFFSSDDNSAKAAQAVGFQCLLETLDSVIKHLDLGCDNEIDKMEKGYVQWCNKIKGKNENP